MKSNYRHFIILGVLLIIFSACGPNLNRMIKNKDVEGLVALANKKPYELYDYTKIFDALVSISTPASEEAIKHFLFTPTTSLQSEQACDALIKINDAQLIEYLVQNYKSVNNDSETQKAAIGCLGKVGTIEAMTALIGAFNFQFEDSGVYIAISYALGNYKDSAFKDSVFDDLVNHLSDPAHEISGEAAMTLGELYDPKDLIYLLDSPQTLNIYVGLLDTYDENVTNALIRALNNMGTSQMATDFLNYGNQQLQDVAETWASAHNYTILRY